MVRKFLYLLTLTAVVACAGAAAGPESVGKWKRLEVAFEDGSWKGNPFDVRLDGLFVSPSGRELRQFGFYAGEDTWKIFFMPDEVGKWTYRTCSPDEDLDGRSGSFRCVQSGLPGQLRPAGSRWELSDGGADFPIIWAPPCRDRWWVFRSRKADDPLVRSQLRLARRTVAARLLGIGDLALAPRDWARDLPQSGAPYVTGKEGERFFLPFWDRLNAKLDAARERGMGLYVMFFTDDALKPDNLGIAPRSEAERRLFRYAVARLACYPIILWDSGIDIGEYRSDEWVEWFARWFRQNDPWQHPVGSRSSGGSGGVHPRAATYFSYGLPTLPSREHLLELSERPDPTAFTDHWRPFIGRGDWTHEKIRVVQWRCGLSGGQATFPDYSQGFQGDADPAGMKRGARYVGHAGRFFRRRIKWGYGKLAAHDELIRQGEQAILAANPGREYVLYDRDGGTVVLDLSRATGRLETRWYDPRNGKLTGAQPVQGGGAHTFRSPAAGEDWVLHLFRARKAE